MTALEYQDRFIYVGEPTEADVRSLIGDPVFALPEDAAAGRKLWHMHRGWFQAEGERDVLVNQNMDAQEGQLDNQPARSLSITTRVDLRFTNEQEGIEGLYGDLDLLHDVANREFARSLLPDVRKMVGLS